MTPAGVRRWRLVRAGSDAVPASVRRFVARRRQARAAVPWALIGALSTVVMVVAWAFYGSTLLSLREVRVTGIEILSAVEVRDAAAVADRTPLIRIDRSEVADRVAALPPVGRVRVRRSWPDTLVIEVTERTAVAAVPVGEEFRLIDDTGIAFHTLAQRPPGLPVLILSDPGPDDADTSAALTVVAALPPPLAAALASLTVTGPAGIELSLRDGRTVLWGDETDSGLKARVATALLDRDAEVIDVSAPDVVGIR